MKILMLTDRMDSGGAETHIAQLIRGLQKSGCAVSLISSGGRLADELKRDGIPCYRAPMGSHSPFVWLRLRRLLRKLILREGFDVLHAHARIPALLIRGLCKERVTEIVTVHAHFHTDPILTRLCNWGKHTVAVSEDLRAYVCDAYGVPAESVRVIPNGVDCQRFTPPPKRDDVPAILFASRLDADCARGAELLCQIAPALLKDYPRLRIRIAGGGSELERIRALADAVNRSTERSLIEVCGWVSDMPSLLQKSHIFVGVSRAAMEAGACGCAVILCGNEGYGGILSPAHADRVMLSNLCCRRMRPPTAQTLEADLRTLLDDPEKRTRLGKDCRDLMRSHFNADGMCDAMLALYHEARPVKKTTRLTVGGYFGCGNTGDDAILQGFLLTLRRVAPQIEVTALTASPRRCQRRFGVRCVNRKNPFAVRRAITRADLFLCGGGSLLQNLTSNRSLSYYLALLRLATRLRKITVLYAAGIGPLIGDKARRRVARALSRCRYVSLRDPDSFRLLTAIGVDAGKLHLSTDPALLLLLPPRSRGEAILWEYHVPVGARYLCVVLRGGTSCALTQNLILAAVRMICLRHGMVPLFPVFDRAHDERDTYAAADKVGGRVIFLREPTDATAVLSLCDAAVTMRLHALILATAVKVPTVGVAADGRDQKIPVFAKSAGQESLSPDGLTVAALVEAIEAALTSDPVHRILADAAEQMRDDAAKDLLRIIQLIPSPQPTTEPR